MKLTVLKNHVPTNEVMVETPDLHERYEIFVGRAEDCHVMIDDPLISRHHFVVTNDDNSWYCEKLTNLGLVTINGSVATKAKLSSGDEIKCGAYSVMVSDLTMVQKAPIQPVYVPNAEPSYSSPVNSSPQVLAPVAASVAAPLIDKMPEVEMNTHKDEGKQEAQPEADFEQHMDEFSNNEGSTNEAPVDEPAAISDFTQAEEPAPADFAVVEASETGFSDVAVQSDDSTRFFKAFVNYQLVLFGEHAPYDRYQIDKEEIFIGRDPKKCQIVLDDPEVSTVHAVLRKNNVDITLEDLNSSNGTILNGERINRAHVATGDEFVIGSTSFTLEVKSDLLDAESERLMPVEAGQFIEKEHIEEEEVTMEEGAEMDFSATDAPKEKSIIKRLQKDPAFRKKAIYVIAVLGLLYVLFGDSEPTDPEKTAEAAKTTKVATPDTAKPVDKNAKPKVVLSKEMEERRNQAYEMGVNYFEQNKYAEAEIQFQIVESIDPTYKKLQTYLEQTRVGKRRLEELEKQKREEEERIKTKKQIEELLVKAREAVKERQVQLAESYFAQIAEKDPENIEVSQLKLELESWQKEEEKKALEKAAKEATRKGMVNSLQPAKTTYLKKEWYPATLKLEQFLQIKNMDEDLVKEASEMLTDAKNQLAAELGPLLGKARSLKEGQDLKGAYAAYLDVLKIEPTNIEALNEVDDIFSTLEGRSKRIYREAIISESLSLFTDAKEKFQEVQQISPTDSEYYKKATDKLKNYLE